MKTRIVYPKNLWFEKKLKKMSVEARLLCIYLITNENVGLTRIYEQKEMETCFILGFDEVKLEKYKKEIELSELFYFKDEWIYINNEFSYCDYSGRDRVMKSKETETNKIPIEVVGYFNALLSGGKEIVKGLDTSSEPVAEVIKKPKGKHKYDESELGEEVCQHIAKLYDVSIQTIKDKRKELELFCKSKGQMYTDYVATLENWVNRDLKAGKIKKIFHYVQSQPELSKPQTEEERTRALSKLDEIRQPLREKLSIGSQK